MTFEMHRPLLQTFDFQNKMLPPGLDNRNPHRYGQLSLNINTQLIKGIMIERVQLNLLGMKRAEERQICNGNATFDFTIATNLWFFYAYLNDARAITFRLIDSVGKVYNCETTLHLLPSQQVLNKNSKDLDFLLEKNSYLLNRISKGEVFDSKYAKIGLAEIEMQLMFEQSINRTLFAASLIDFEDILVIDEISPIGSTVELEEPQSYNPPVPQIDIKQTIRKDNVPQSLRYFEQQERQVEALPEDDMNADEKMMQDDIDRLIAQMQNKPYDSSKYMQEDHHQPKQENINRTNFIATSSQPYPYQKRSSEKKNSAEKIPQSLPPIMKSQALKQEFSLSPQNKFAFTASEPVIHYHNSHTMSLTQRQSFTQTLQTRDHQKRTGLIRLKVHEFTMSKMQKQLSLLLKICLNEDEDEFYSVNGLKQGESISFNSNLKIDQRREIDTIRFVMIDAFDMKAIFAQGTFQMNRLFSQNPTKGVFMVNLLSSPSPQQQSFSKVVRLQQQSLVRVVPNLKNLRIELQYQEPIDIVQIYLSLANFSPQCRKICYKIPLTRETIQFRLSELSNGRHMNIFPHNRSSLNRTADRIIIELWGDVDLIGFNEISLKQISNTNQSIINSSLEPILLYDQTREVVDIKNAKNRASYWFKLYYGTVAQVQSILNREDNRQKRVQLPKKPVQVEKHLGIYIKQAKKSRQVEIQVDETQAEDVWRGSQKNILQLQQEELPDDEDEDEEEEEVEDNHKESSENQFISPSIEQKYMNGRETVPIPKMNTSQPLDKGSKMQLSQTIKSKALSSLTKKFQQEIGQVLSDFSSQQQLYQLKEECKSHLLYNFIEANILIQILRKMGISLAKIDYLLRDIIPVTNELINVNILYDMILALILEGEVKEKFIDDAQIGRFCLMVLYRQNMDKQERDEVIFDESTEFDESRKFFEEIGYRITMREFNLIHIFIKKQSEAGIAYKKIRENLLQQHLKKVKEEQVKQTKEKEIVSKLYQHQWDDDDDFFICNINQHNNQSQEISINPTINDAASNKSKEFEENTRLFKAPLNNPSKRQLTEVKLPSTVSIPPSSQRGKSKEVFKATQRQTTRTKVNFSLTIEGFQKCIETTECLLNISLTAPKLKITHRSEKTSDQSWINYNQQTQCYEVQFLIEDSQFFQGSIELVDSSASLARCNVSVMAGMKSCYSLKNLQTQQFCGILKLLLSPIQ